MTAAAEWNEENHPVVPLPTIVSSTDLFDGELFGDELMDIYNNSVDNSSSTLPNAAADLLDPNKKDEDGILAAAAMGDGFGSFRPSTSFNDLTSLLTPDGQPKPIAPVSSAETTTKKRAGAAIPANKRKTARVEKPSGIKMGATTKAALAAAEKNSAAVAAAAKSTTADSSDFKSIAQAAVSSLMMSASSTADDSKKEKVDTSTAHIKALTGNNWVAACAGAATSVVAASTEPKSSNNRARRQNLTPDERARQNRDRNREHARNTRLRKKAYVEELKRTLTELVSQRDAAELEKRQAAQRELEQREVRFRVIEEFLKLRGRNETNFARWAAILEDGFSLTAPCTDIRNFGKDGFEQTLQGVSEVMTDASVFAGFLQSLGNNNTTTTVVCQYQCDRKNFFMDGCQAVLEWTATSVGAVKKGLPSELIIKGSVRGKFSPASNKLLSAKMSVDTGAVLVQLQKLTNVAVAKQADAIIDSLEMPNIEVVVSDESDAEQAEKKS